LQLEGRPTARQWICVAAWSRFTGGAYVLGYREVTFAAWEDGRCPRRAVRL